jgi:antitoxin (DNA-binding transcriptional repressor) of toxin-antitoxin stability system
MGAHSVAEAKARLSEILTRLEAGREVTTSRRGRAKFSSARREVLWHPRRQAGSEISIRLKSGSRT